MGEVASYNKSTTINESTVDLSEYAFDQQFDALIIGINVASIIVNVIGNGFVFMLIVTKRRLHSSTNYYIASLCLADITVAVVSTPVEISYHFINQNLKADVCKVANYFNYVSVAAFLFCVVVVAYDRHQLLVHPLRPKTSVRNCLRNIAIVWGLSAIYGVRGIVTYGTEPHYRFYDNAWVVYPACDYIASMRHIQIWLNVLDFLALYIIPLSIISVLYYQIGKSMAIVCQNATSMTEATHRRTTVIKMILMVVCLFVFCQLPLHVYRFYENWAPDGGFHGSIVVHNFAEIIAFSSGWLNVIAYMYFNEPMRNVSKSLCHQCWNRGKRQVHPATVESITLN